MNVRDGFTFQNDNIREDHVFPFQIDNVIILSDGLRYDGPDGAKIEEFLGVYRHLINPNVLFVSIDLSSNQTGYVSPG